MKIGNIVWSWDLWRAIVCTIATYFWLSPQVKSDFAKDLYGVGISVLSIVFAVYFAALAIIMASPDDDFIAFMNEEGDYARLIASLQFTQWALFVGLVFSLILYARTENQVSAKIETQSRAWLAAFSLIFIYALCSAAAAVHDAIQYSKVQIAISSHNERSARSERRELRTSLYEPII